MEPDPTRWGSAPRAPAGPVETLTVSALTRIIKERLEPSLSRVIVEGEISNLARPRSGHVYFTLKDERAQIAAVLWRPAAAGLRFAPRDGLRVIAWGRIAVYEPRGVYQIVCERLVPRGVGELALAFEDLKRRLAEEGLFDPARKKPLPFLPGRIGIVTSPTGAAIRDILESIGRRLPRASVRIFPVRVQGEGAAAEIAEAIALANAIAGADILIVGRGGGSIEDLWAFNEEIVARAIAASAIPVISAVGHEVDVTIADFVADARALTPTAAGALAVPEEAALRENLGEARGRMEAAVRRHASEARDRLGRAVTSAAFARPLDRIRRAEERLDDRRDALRRSLYTLRDRWHDRLKGAAARLEALSPLRVLDRGYSVTSDPTGRAIRAADDVAPGERIRTRVRQGTIWSIVERTGEAGGGG
ncbi:MAG: exodeoxyribonuclease VII large subunit [Planctomycetes bacterium]|nr:exodeoxyribonuclease VII large subunit [Planctomycetota bacterium]